MLRLALGAIAVSRRLWLEAGMANSPSSNPQQNNGDRQATVLVVDDDPILQTMILDYFVDNNIQTLLASGREEMLRQLSAQEVDVVILDLRLGLEDGLDALRELRSRFDLLVIIITGHRRDEIDRVVGLELGADDYMTKPFNLRDFWRGCARSFGGWTGCAPHLAGARTRRLSVFRLAAQSAHPKAHRSEWRGRCGDQRRIRAARRVPQRSPAAA
jgi:CheY-like chemotaxis protein